MSKTSILVAALQNAYEQQIEKLEKHYYELSHSVSSEDDRLTRENSELDGRVKYLDNLLGTYRATIGDLENEIKSLRDTLDGFKAVKSPDLITEADFEQPDFIVTVTSTTDDSSGVWEGLLAAVLYNLLRENNYKSTTDGSTDVSYAEVRELQKPNIKIVAR